MMEMANAVDDTEGPTASDVANSPRELSEQTTSSLMVIQQSLDRVDKSIGDLAKSIQNLATVPMNSFVPPPTASSQPSSSSAPSVSDSDENEDQNHNIHPLRNPIRTIAEVRKCNLEGFKNRYTEEEGCYAIEYLVSDSHMYSQMKEETVKRKNEGVYTPRLPLPPPLSMPPPPPPPLPYGEGQIPGFLPPPPPPPVLLAPNVPAKHYRDDPWIHRVRINSRAVMELLGSCSKEGNPWKGSPRTFVHPFRYLIFFHDAMKRKVEAITKGVVEEPSFQNEDAKDSEREDISSVQSERENQSTPYGFISKEGKEELRCYIKFVEEHLIPPSRRFEKPNVSKSQTVRYHELDYLFKLGQYVYMERSNHVGKPVVTEQRVKRVYDVTSKTMCICPAFECEHRDKLWMLHCYYLDHDGERYGALCNPVHVWFWEGERNITELNFYPLEYLPGNREAEVQQAMSDGANFVGHLTKRYSFYSGWSLTKGPDLKPIDDPKTSEPMKNPEHVESDVLVDLTETFDSIPSWKPSFDYVGPRPPPPPSPSDKLDTLPIIDWSDKSRKTLKSSWQEIIHDDLWIHEAEARKFIDGTQALCLTEFNAPHMPTPSGDELALLPRRMFAYAVWDRKFLPIDSRYLKRTERHGEEGEAFAQLQILDDNKRLISALLQSHFRKKELESQGIEVPTQDLIRGKGRGIVILLHGVPGVGKTATAEAVAQKWRRPLFPITCGDLGFTPEKVEASLKEIFRLAHRWDCVLLLDEADVFIAQREKTGADLQRNALVSVFLRMLEYYNGVLFLTTNRVGVLDEAIKSRVHLHLKYNNLNKDQTVEIFKHNIKRLRVIEEQRGHDSRLIIAENEILDFARRHYDQHSDRPGIGMWNGRQIRNAFLIAASLAHHDGDLERESDPAMQKQLRASHFDLVDKATVSYDQDRAETLGHTDSELAYDRMERNDPRNRQGQAGHGGAAFGYSAPRSHAQPPNFVGGQYTSGSFQGTSQSVYPSQTQQQMHTGPQSYGGPMSEPRSSSMANEPRSDTGFINSGQQGYAPFNTQTSDTRGGATPWQAQNDGQWR